MNDTPSWLKSVKPETYASITIIIWTRFAGPATEASYSAGGRLSRFRLNGPSRRLRAVRAET